MPFVNQNHKFTTSFEEDDGDEDWDGEFEFGDDAFSKGNHHRQLGQLHRNDDSVEEVDPFRRPLPLPPPPPPLSETTKPLPSPSPLSILDGRRQSCILKLDDIQKINASRFIQESALSGDKEKLKELGRLTSKFSRIASPAKQVEKERFEDMEFDLESPPSIPATPHPKTIRGIKADPKMVEVDWEDDFDFDDSNVEEGDHGPGDFLPESSLPCELTLPPTLKLRTPTSPQGHRVRLYRLHEALKNMRHLVSSWGIAAEGVSHDLPSLSVSSPHDIELIEGRGQAADPNHPKNPDVLKEKAQFCHENKDYFPEASAWYECALVLVDLQRGVEAMSSFNQARKALCFLRETPNAVTLAEKIAFFDMKLLLEMSENAHTMADIFQTKELLLAALAIYNTYRLNLHDDDTRRERGRGPLHSLAADISLSLGLWVLDSRGKGKGGPSSLPHIMDYLFYHLYSNCQNNDVSHIHSGDCLLLGTAEMTLTAAATSINWFEIGKGAIYVAKCLIDFEDSGDESVLHITANDKEFRPLVKDFILQGKACLAFAPTSGKNDAGNILLMADHFLEFVWMNQSPRSDLATPNFDNEEPATDDFDYHPGGNEGSGINVLSWAEESGEEDWDMELGIDTMNDRGASHLSLFGTSPEPQIISREVCQKYKLLDACTHKKFQIIKYPAPTFLFSLTTREDHAFFHESDLEQFLGNIVAKHCLPEILRYRGLVGTIDGEENLHNVNDEKLNQFRIRVDEYPKFSKGWANAHLRFCLISYNEGSQELAWIAVTSLFIELKEFPLANTKKEKHHCKDLFKVFLILLYIVAKMWRSEYREGFKEMLVVAKRIAPGRFFSYLIDLIEIEAYAHYQLNRMELESDNVLSDIELGDLNGSFEDEMDFDPFQELLHIYAQTHAMKGKWHIIQARVLIDIHLLLSGHSPLTCRKSKNTTMFEKLDEDGFQDMIDGETDSSEHLKGPTEILTTAIRMTRLFEIYPEIPISFFKAKAAFALGLFCEKIDDVAKAEKLYFEAIYILDQTKPPSKGFPSIISVLGTETLIRYAEVLLAGKYQYAILCLEAASLNYDICKKQEDYFTLIRRVASITRENNDWLRSIEIYNEILATYVESRRVNEIVYVSNILSGMYQERGEFSLAESVLDQALEFVPNPFPDEREIPQDMVRVDPIFFQLQFKKAQLYLASYAFERGIEVLELLNKGILPYGKRNELLELLARAYAKKGWARECAEIVDGFHADYNDENSLNFWELATRMHYHSYSFARALSSVDIAIDACPESSLSTLGQLYYLRGKILLSLGQDNTSSLVFPLKIEIQVPKQPHIQFTRKEDILQECIASFSKAYSYFRSAGDDLRLAKSVQKIAEAYIDWLFPQVCLLERPLNDVITFIPKFRGSPLTSIEDDGVEWFVVTFDVIEQPLLLCLDICANFGDALLMLTAYLTAARLRLIQKDSTAALSYFSEFKELFDRMFLFNGPNLICGNNIPITILKRIHPLLRRTVEFIFAFESDFINNHFCFLDIFFMVELELEQAQKRIFSLTQTHFSTPLTPRDDSLSPQHARTPPPRSPFVDNWASSPDEKLQQSSPHLRRFKHNNSPRRSVADIFSDEPHSQNGAELLKLPSLPPTHSTEYSDVHATKKPSLPILDRHSTKIMGNHLAHLSPLQRISQLYDLSSQASREIWQHVTCLKNRIRHFLTGRISQEELLNNNHESLSKIIGISSKTKHRFHSFKHNWGETFPNYPLNSYTFSDFERIPCIGQKLTYALQAGRFFFFYVPSTGTKRISPVVGEGDATSCISKTCPDDTSKAQEDCFIQVRLYLLAQKDQHVTYLVHPLLTLSNLLRHCCTNKEGSKTKKKHLKKKGGSVFIPFPKYSNGTILVPPKFISATPHFFEELDKILSLVGMSKGLNASSSSLGLTESTFSSTSSVDDVLMSSSDSKSSSHSRKNTVNEMIKMLAFAKKSNSPDDDAMIPLSDYSDIPIGDCFPFEEVAKVRQSHSDSYYSREKSSVKCENGNLLNLFIYLNTNPIPPSDGPTAPVRNKQLFSEGESIQVCKSAIISLCALLDTKRPSDEETEEAKLRKALFELSDGLKSFMTIIPTPKVLLDDSDYNSDLEDDEALPSKKFGFFNKSEKKCKFRPIRAPPTILICGRSLQMIPWELLINDDVVRYFTSKDVLIKYQQQEAQRTKNRCHVPKYFGCYYSQGDKQVGLFEEKRITNLKELLLAQLSFDCYPIPLLDKKSISSVPFRLPLVAPGRRISSYRRKYKYLQFFDLFAHVVESPLDICEFVNRNSSTNQPVFILTFSDLFDLTTSSYYLSNVLYSKATIIFVQASKMVHICKKLMKIQDHFLSITPKKPELRDKLQFLLSAIHESIRAEGIPYIVLNPPLYSGCFSD